MAVVITGARFVPVWLDAARHLLANGRRVRNVVLEVSSPTMVTAGDKAILASVDSALRHHAGLSIQTVAGTIFPQGLYRRHGADGLEVRYLRIMKRAKARGTWGTYAMRLMERRGRDPSTTFSPLQQTINKLRRASTSGNAYESVYELSPHTADDLDTEELAYGCEIPTFDSAADGEKISNMPCLSHLSFKLANRDTVELTAIYRSHWYVQRALGNLLGLGQLLAYVAEQAELQVGTLTCISTDAVLDLNTWGGVAEGSRILTGLTD